MNKEAPRFYLLLSKIGVLFIGLVSLRALWVHQDSLSYVLGFAGFLLIIANIRSTERRLGVTRKRVWIEAGIFAAVLVPLAYLMVFPK